MGKEVSEDLVNETYSPITKDGIQLVSTPLHINQLSGDDNFQQDSLSTRLQQGHIVSTPKRDRLPSILKPYNGESSQLNLELDDDDDSYIPDAILKNRPEVGNDRSRRTGPDLTASRSARVIFSPTKEVVSYRDEYFNDYYHDEDHMNRNYMTRQKHDVILESIDPPKPPKSNFWEIFSDPNVPYVLSLYLQILFNLFIILILFYFGFILYKGVKEDINLKFNSYIIDAKHEISRCTREYLRNKCSTENGKKRVPALENICVQLEKCMNRDPQLIAKSKITAETFADIINGFIKPISWKALFFMNVILFGSLIVSNVAFGKYRNQINPERNKNIQLQNRINHLEKLLQNYETSNHQKSILQSQHTTEVFGRNGDYQTPLIHRKGF